MEALRDVHGLVIEQKKEWGEIFTDFETRNRYTVLDTDGRPLYHAAEEGGSFLARHFLRAHRSFTIHIRNTDGSPFLRVERPFRWYFHELAVLDSGNQQLGTVKRQWSLLEKRYVITDRYGAETLSLRSRVFHPWTFEITSQQTSRGKISKKWSGLGKEMFTDADNFAVLFEGPLREDQKALLLGAVFLIDFVHFENRGRD